MSGKTQSQSALVIRKNRLMDVIQSTMSSSSGAITSAPLDYLALPSLLPTSLLPSAKAAGDISERLAKLRIDSSPATMRVAAGEAAKIPKSIAEQLFDATAAVKILTSQVAMHLDDQWRQRLFQQLDSLHDIEEWESEDRPVERASFSTFLKAICDLKPNINPGLGLSGSGYLVAAWTHGRNRLTLQFMPNDRVKWVISRYVDDELDQVAGDTSVRLLSDALSPYKPSEWFANAEYGSTDSSR